MIEGVFDGDTEASIADELGISSHTVHTYLVRLYRKLKVSNRCELLIRVFAEHLDVNVGARQQAPPPSRPPSPGIAASASCTGWRR